jgi:hypothetical protein
MRKDEAVGNKKKMQVCLPKHNYKLVNNLLTVESPGLLIRIVLMRIRSRIRIQLKILMRIRIQIRGGGGLVSQNVHPPWQNPRYAPVSSPGMANPKRK